MEIGVEIFTKVAEKMGGKVGENDGRLGAARRRFFAILEKPEEVPVQTAQPPDPGRG